MAKSTSETPRTVPNEVLQQLADIGRVPAAEREFFFESVCQIVKEACEWDGLVKQGLTSKRGKNLVCAALSFYDALGNLHKHERAFIEVILGGKPDFIFDRISSGGIAGLEQTAYQLALLSSFVTGKPPPRIPSETPEPPQPGRRSGTVKNWIFQYFVSQLYVSTAAAGGRLTYEKNIPTGGWVEAIYALAPIYLKALCQRLCLRRLSKESKMNASEPKRNQMSWTGFDRTIFRSGLLIAPTCPTSIPHLPDQKLRIFDHVLGTPVFLAFRLSVQADASVIARMIQDKWRLI